MGLKPDIRRVQINQTLPSKFKFKEERKLISKYWDIGWSTSSQVIRMMEGYVQISRKPMRSTNDVVSKNAKQTVRVDATRKNVLILFICFFS